MIAMPHINDHIVPISRFNKGEANKILDEVARDGFRYVVKNNEVKCIMFSPEAYDKLIESIEDYYDSRWAEDRLARDKGSALSMKDVMKHAGITMADVEAAEDVRIG